MGTVNAVNITDGIDGLSSSVTLPVAAFFTWEGCMPVLAALPAYYGQLSIFSAALLGGLLGFLLYNHYPAKVFMGDTGSLFLGGAVAALAFAYDMPLILILVGFVYICETLSDIIQVAYFKLTHGKRIFKMAPLHHHFEMCGWSEKKVVAVFTAVSLLFCLLAVVAVFLQSRIMAIISHSILKNVRKKCGIGKCGHCKIGETYICLDGPVFNYTDGKNLID